MSWRQYDALWKAAKAKQRRGEAMTSLLVEQTATLIAMVANTGMLQWENGLREAAEFLPVNWSNRYGDAPPEPEIDFDAQMERTMRRAVAYQNGQSARGLAKL